MRSQVLRSSLVVAWCALAAWCFSASLAVGQEAAEHPAEAAAHDSAHAEAGHGSAEHGGEHGDTNPLTTDVDLAVYTAVVFLLLVFILGKFAWKPIAEGLDRREQTIAEQIEAANRTHQEAKNLLAMYDKRLTGAQDEVKAMLDQARRDATQASQEMLNKATADATDIKDRAVRDIETAKGAALKELAESSGRMAVDLAGKIVRDELDAGRHQRLIQESLERFPAGSAGRG